MPESSPAPIPPPVQRPARYPLLLVMFALLLSALSFAAAVYLWDSGSQARRRVEERVADMRREVQDSVRPTLKSLTQRQDEYATVANQIAQQQLGMDQTLSQTAEGLARLNGVVQGGRRGWQLYEVEYLLLTANDRLQLQQDVRGAARALELASQRIAAFAEPSLTPVRERIIQELAALRAVPQPDTQEITLVLSTLIGELPQLPLAYSAPENYAAPAHPEDNAEPPAGGFERFWRALRKSLRGLFYLRREGRPLEPLLPPEQEFFLQHNLALKLETARLAALQRDTQSFRTSLSGARAWLEEFYAPKHPQVAAAIQQIAALEREELQWTLPDISGSLELLRKQIEARGLGAAPQAPRPQAAPARAESAGQP